MLYLNYIFEASVVLCVILGFMVLITCRFIEETSFSKGQGYVCVAAGNWPPSLGPRPCARNSCVDIVAQAQARHLNSSPPWFHAWMASLSLCQCGSVHLGISSTLVWIPLAQVYPSWKAGSQLQCRHTLDYINHRIFSVAWCLDSLSLRMLACATI